MSDRTTLDRTLDPDTQDAGPVVEEVVEEPAPIWAESAREVLLEVAGKYGAVVTSKELAAEVQARTQVTTTQAPHYWIGDVLALVAEECHRLSEPLLPSFCVNPQGAVVSAYAKAVSATRDEPVENADDHAARERLACHRHHDATGLPADGGRPALTPRLAATRARERKNALAERVLPVCPTCHHQLASAGTCDNCD